MRYQTTGRNPGPPSPRTKPAEVRLDELMAAAEKLFLAKGVEATTISEIVEEAQVAKGTFYHYFASKNEMLTALGNRYTARFLERLRNAVDGCPPATGGRGCKPGSASTSKPTSRPFARTTSSTPTITTTIVPTRTRTRFLSSCRTSSSAAWPPAPGRPTSPGSWPC